MTVFIRIPILILIIYRFPGMQDTNERCAGRSTTLPLLQFIVLC